MKVIVYQMGKVGSASVHRSLLAYGGVDVEHVHEVDPEYVRNVRGVGCGSPEWARLARLRKLMAGDEPLKIITLVREPIARNVSLLWETYGAELTKYPERASELWERLLHDEVLTWFDREFQRALRIDVYAHKLDCVRGHSVIKDGMRQVLILKCEVVDYVKQAAISEFLGISGFTLNRHNENRSLAYSEFLGRFQVSQSYAHKMASAKYTRHFYTDEEIRYMCRLWSERWTEYDPG